MQVGHPIVQLIYAQAIVFVLSWSLAFLLGHRIRFGHWTLSLLYVAALETTAYFLVDPLPGPIPSPLWWLAVAAVAILIIALTDSWNALGQACMVATVSLSVLFLVYLVQVTAGAHLGLLSLLLSGILLVLQTFALVLLCAGSYEILDVLCRKQWRRVADAKPTEDWFPKVSLHVPAYNEPPEMVIETLDALARIDYPNYEVIVIDDNTPEEATWRPLEAHCKQLGFRFFHLENWPGFKSGALNYALTQTDPEAILVGIVDSDYVVKPDYLRRCVGFFREASVAFVQTPQDYRDLALDDRYAVACYDAYRYFFRISMASRNEHNGIIFAGTMGLIRKNVLHELGGWDEWCITEDAEISLRILDRGYRGIYVDQSFGQGLMPFNFEGLKKQRFRWAFGGMQILRRHRGALVPWARWANSGHRMSFAQQWDYLMGGLQWLNDPATFAFTVLLLVGTAALVFAHSLFIQPLVPAVMIVPFLFIFVGVTRFLWALRVRLGCGWGRATSAFAILLGLTWVVTMACVLGLSRKEGVFLRTAKKHAGVDRWHPFRMVSYELAIASLCLVGAVALLGNPHRSFALSVMIGLLAWQAVIYSSALLCSLWGYRSELRVLHPEYLAASRSTGERFSSMIPSRPVAWGIAALAILGILGFVLAVRLAPEGEVAYRSNPERVAMIPAEAMEMPPTDQVKATIYLEKEAAMTGSVDRALALWSPDGIVRDARNTASDTSDDSVWAGAQAVRRRYEQEFARHRYLTLRHVDASVVIQGDTAVVVNDLYATIETPSGLQHIFLSRGDRWRLVRSEQGWRILNLDLNRAPR